MIAYEIKQSYVDTLNRSIERVLTLFVHALFIMDGIELNPPEKREEYELKLNLDH